MKRAARLHKKGVQAMQLGAFDDLLILFEIEALHDRIGEAYQSKKQRVKVARSMISEERESCNAGQTAEYKHAT